MTSILQPKTLWQTPQQPVTGPASELAKVDKIVIHYPGVGPGNLNLADPVGTLRNTQNYYITSRGYSIGYNFCVFPGGRWEARGFSIKNAANKGPNSGPNLNASSISVNVMVNGQDKATDSQVIFVQDMIRDIWTVLNKEVPLVGHGSLDGTQCPGTGINQQLKNGLFIPPPVGIPPTDPPLKDEEMYLLTNLETRSFGGSTWPPKTIIYNLDNDGKLRHIPEIEGLIRGTANAPKQAVSNAYLDALPQ